MICPACGQPLTPQQVTETTVDACVGGCGGIWFDNFELSRIEDPANQEAQTLLNIPYDPAVHVDFKMKRHCPRCQNQIMRRRFSSRLRAVEIDHCPACNGIWLDAGELRRIRSEAAAKAGAAKKQAGR